MEKQWRESIVDRGKSMSSGREAGNCLAQAECWGYRLLLLDLEVESCGI